MGGHWPGRAGSKSLQRPRRPKLPLGPGPESKVAVTRWRGGALPTRPPVRETRPEVTAGPSPRGRPVTGGGPCLSHRPAPAAQFRVGTEPPRAGVPPADSLTPRPRPRTPSRPPPGPSPGRWPCRRPVCLSVWCDVPLTPGTARLSWSQSLSSPWQAVPTRRCRTNIRLGDSAHKPRRHSRCCKGNRGHSCPELRSPLALAAGRSLIQP